MDSISIDTQNTILIKVIKAETEAFSTNDFIELFLDDGPLAQYKEYVFGISIHNHYLKIFAVNLTKEIPENLFTKLLNDYLTPQHLNTSTGFSIQLQASLPQKPLKMVTLFPVPFNVSDEQINQLTASWGQKVNHDFGRHKRFPAFRNSYLHIHFKTTIPENIPDTIKINEKFITVMIQGEEQIPRCGYCKMKNHSTDECSARPPRLQRFDYAAQTRRPRSYANALHHHHNAPTRPPTSPKNRNQHNLSYSKPYMPAASNSQHFPALTSNTPTTYTKNNATNIEKELEKCAIDPEDQTQKINNTTLINIQTSPPKLSDNPTIITSSLADETMIESTGIIPETNPHDMKTSPDFSPFYSNILDEIDIKQQSPQSSFSDEQSDSSESDNTIIEESPHSSSKTNPKRKKISDESQSSDPSTKPPNKRNKGKTNKKHSQKRP